MCEQLCAKAMNSLWNYVFIIFCNQVIRIFSINLNSLLNSILHRKFVRFVSVNGYFYTHSTVLIKTTTYPIKELKGVL